MSGNILMLGDRQRNSIWSDAQSARLDRDFGTGANLAVVEAGAGRAVPAVRVTSESIGGGMEHLRQGGSVPGSSKAPANGMLPFHRLS